MAKNRLKFKSAGGALAVLVFWSATTAGLPIERDAGTGGQDFLRGINAQEPILLPPVRVEESVMSGPWRYAQAPGLEILSHCSDDVTAELVTQNQELLTLLSVILPRQLQARSDVPTSFIFLSDKDKSAFDPEVLKSLQRAKSLAVAAGAGSDQLPAVPPIEVLPNFRFWDQDAVAIFFIWQETSDSGGQLMISPGYLRYLLEKRTPTLPAWFVGGMSEFYRSVSMNPPTNAMGVRDDMSRSYGVSVGASVSNSPGANTITVAPVSWMSDRQTRLLRKDPRLKPRLLPLGSLFTESAPTEADPEQETLRRAQGALLIRWALDSGKEARREALWKFVEQTSTRPATEVLFRECFGLTYAEAEDHLGDYLHHAINATVTLRPATSSDPLPVNMRDATTAEVSRIKGGFNRLEINYVRQVFPQMAGQYIEQARRTLRKAYDAGERDPRLTAELGLCECDAENDAGARPFLETAVRSGVARPRAYYELARIRLAGLRAADPAARLTPEQLSSVLTPLFQMRRYAPALPEAYQLMAKAWLCSDAPPGPEQLAAFDEGMGVFPRDAGLIYSVALVHATHGHLADAQKLIARGLAVTSSSLARTRLQELQSAITSNSSPAPR